MRNIIAILCLLSCALAAEEKPARKSRQILAPLATPLVPIEHHPHIIHADPYLHQPRVLASAVQYFQADPTVGLVQHAAVIPQVPASPAAFALQHPSYQRTFGLVQSAIQSVNGQQYGNQQNYNLQQNLNNLQRSSQNGQQQMQNNLQRSNQNGPQMQNTNQLINDYYSQAQAQGSNGQSSQNSQFDTSIGSSQLYTPYDITASSQNNGGSQQRQSLSRMQMQNQNSLGINSQSSNDESNNQQSGAYSYLPQSAQQQQQNQGQFLQQPQQQTQFQLEQPQQQSDNQQQNAQSRSRFIAQFDDNNQQSQNNNQAQGQNGQQNLALYPRNQYNDASRSYGGNQQGSSRNDQIAAILSQSGQISLDGSYSYGFQSDNGIQSSQVGMIRNYGPHASPLVHGSYSYTAPDGTPISAQYYADHTGFHVRGAHIPSPPPSPGYNQGPQQQQQQQQPQQPIEVQSN